jgi:hypothetical protein
MPTQRSYPRARVGRHGVKWFATVLLSEDRAVDVPGEHDSQLDAFAAARTWVEEQGVTAATVAVPDPLAAVTPPPPAPAAPGSVLPVPVPTRCPSCRCRVRRASEPASMWPGSVTMKDKLGHCAKCKKQVQAEADAAAVAAEEQPAPAAAATIVIEPAPTVRIDEMPPLTPINVEAKALVEQLEPEPSKPKARKPRADKGRAHQGAKKPTKSSPARAVRDPDAPDVVVSESGGRRPAPATHCPACGRAVRPANTKAGEAPGTVPMARVDGTCLSCKKGADQNRANRAAGRAPAAAQTPMPKAFEEPRRSAVVPTARPKPAPTPSPPPKPPPPPPVTVLGSGPITGPVDPFEQTLHTLNSFMARRHARGNRPTPVYLDRKVQV